MTTIFPTNPLGIKLEILINSVWTDISIYLYQRNDINITNLGRADWTGTIQSASVTLTLNNRTGRFSPKNTSGAYYPYLTRNVQIRISVNSESTALVAYSGFRFWGEVSEWPINWDSTAADVYCDITASGSWRRVSQNAQPIGSAYKRYIQSLSPQAYWPMEDAIGSTFFQAGVSGGSNATPSGGLKALNYASVTDFKGSDAIPGLNSSSVTANNSGGTVTDNVIRLLLSVPSSGDSGAAAGANWNIMHATTAGTLTGLDLYLMANGTLRFVALNSGGTQVVVSTTTQNAKGVPLIVSIELTPSGSSTVWTFNVIKPGATSITESHTGTLTSTSIGAVSQIVLSRANQLQNTGVGHLVLFYASVPSLVTAASALSGWNGEFAMDRFVRLCTENGIGHETIGTSSTSAAMGPQIDDTLPNLFQTIEDTDCGLLYESIDQFGLGYRTKASMQNQVSALNMNYATATLAGTLQPVFDDQLTKNVVTATDQTGNQATATLISGAMSIVPPPSGIGPGYNYSRTINASLTTQATTVAQFLLGIGAVDESRYPLITIDLARPEVASSFSSFPALRIGDFFQITNLPTFHVSTTAKQLVWGYSETLNNYKWTIVYNAVPETPWETTYSPGTVQTTTGVGSGGTSAGSLSLAAISSIISNEIQANPVFVSQLPQLTASLIGSIGVLNFDPYFAGGDPGDWVGFNGVFAVTNAPPAGTPYTFAGQFTISTAGVGAAAEESGTPFLVTPLNQYLVTCWVYTAQTTVVIGFDWQDSTHTFLSTNTQTFTVTANTWTQVTTVQTAASSARYAYPRVAPTDGAGNSIFFTACLCFPQVPGSLVQAGTITATQIAAGTIFAGIVDGTTIMGAHLIADGTSGDILVYSSTPALNNLIGSWSPVAGSDSLGNNFPAGLNTQENTFGTNSVLFGAQLDFRQPVANPVMLRLNPQGLFLYTSSGGASGNLQCSLAVAAGTDAFGNSYPVGVEAVGMSFIKLGSNPAAGANGPIMYADNTGTAIGVTTSTNMQPQIVMGNTDTTSHSVSVTAITVITKPYTVRANDAQPGTVYVLKAWGNGTQGSTQHGPNFYLSGFAVNNQAHVPFSTLFVGASTAFTWIAEGIVSIDPAGNTATFTLLCTVTAFGTTIVSTSSLTGVCNNSAVPITINADENMLIAFAWDSVTGTTAPIATCLGSSFKRLGA